MVPQKHQCKGQREKKLLGQNNASTNPLPSDGGLPISPGSLFQLPDTYCPLH